MRSKLFFVGMLLAILTLQCNKADDDFEGEEVIRGRLGYVDNYSGDGMVRPLPNRIVRLAYAPSDTLNFLLADTTDADGYFLFKNVKKNKKYDLFFRDTITGSKFLGVTTATAPDNTVALVAVNDQTQQNGIVVETRLNSQAIGRVRICLFNNQTLFNADTCRGSIQSDTSDNSGRKVFYHLLPGTYYLRAYTSISGIVYMAVSSVTVGAAGISPLVLDLQRADPVNGLAVEVLDQFNTPVSGTTVCLFNSRALFQADTACTGSILNNSTGVNGKISFSNLLPGEYYIRARAQFGNTVLKGEGNATISASGMVTRTIVVN